LKPASTNHTKVLRRKVGPLAQHDARKSFDRRDDSPHRYIGQRLHLALAPCKKRRACPGRLGTQLTHDVGRRRQIIGLGETPLIAFDESIEQRITILFPGASTGHEIDRAQEPHDIDHRRASGGGVEVIDPPGILGQRELLDMRVSMQPHNWQALQITAEVVADTRDPRAVDESEIIVRVSAESLDQLGRRVFERFQLGAERPRAARCSHHRNGDHCEQTEAPEFSEPMHVVVSLRR
jgi:hypothetical protein